jgi:predicted GNAT superfamily acetyltransferase
MFSLGRTRIEAAACTTHRAMAIMASRWQNSEIFMATFGDEDNYCSSNQKIES